MDVLFHYFMHALNDFEVIWWRSWTYYFHYEISMWNTQFTYIFDEMIVEPYFWKEIKKYRAFRSKHTDRGQHRQVLNENLYFMPKLGKTNSFLNVWNLKHCFEFINEFEFTDYSFQHFQIKRKIGRVKNVIWFRNKRQICDFRNERKICEFKNLWILKQPVLAVYILLFKQKIRNTKNNTKEIRRSTWSNWNVHCI